MQLTRPEIGALLLVIGLGAAAYLLNVPVLADAVISVVLIALILRHAANRRKSEDPTTRLRD